MSKASLKVAGCIAATGMMLYLTPTSLAGREDYLSPSAMVADERGKTLYIDDLVVADDVRSRGYGKALLDWVFQHAVESGCNEVHLDSGTQRKGAHRFYERECYEMNCLHFRKIIEPASW